MGHSFQSASRVERWLRDIVPLTPEYSGDGTAWGCATGTARSWLVNFFSNSGRVMFAKEVSLSAERPLSVEIDPPEPPREYVQCVNSFL